MFQCIIWRSWQKYNARAQAYEEGKGEWLKTCAAWVRLVFSWHKAAKLRKHQCRMLWAGTSQQVKALATQVQQPEFYPQNPLWNDRMGTGKFPSEIHMHPLHIWICTLTSCRYINTNTDTHTNNKNKVKKKYRMPYKSWMTENYAQVLGESLVLDWHPYQE